MKPTYRMELTQLDTHFLAYLHSHYPNFRVELKLTPIPKKKNTVRQGWAEAFKEMHKNGDDCLVINELNDTHLDNE